MRNRLKAVWPSEYILEGFAPKAALPPIDDVDPGWRKELFDIALGRSVNNQGVEAKAARTWNNLRFRSGSEIHIAKALDRAGVLFLPNCIARLGIPERRQNREADFLVCYNGKWGILEVDGERFHPPSRTAEDHERDRLFQAHGILVVQHFHASECYEIPEAVVRRFLDILNLYGIHSPKLASL